MKKLMIAVAAVATVGAVFAECGKTPTTVANAIAYQVKMSVRTTKGVAVDTIKNYAGWCTKGTKDAVAVRVPTYTVYSGWVYDCTPTCDTIANGSLVLWDSVRQVEVGSAKFGSDDFIHVIGTTQRDAEWNWNITGTQVYGTSNAQALDFIGSGFGYFNGAYYTAFSGYLAGTMSAPFVLGYGNTNCDPAGYWECDKLDELVTDDDTIAYGAWVIQYSAAASEILSRYGEAYFYKVATPSYVAKKVN